MYSYSISVKNFPSHPFALVESRKVGRQIGLPQFVESRRLKCDGIVAIESAGMKVQSSSNSAVVRFPYEATHLLG